jgi:hypothetical protein
MPSISLEARIRELCAKAVATKDSGPADPGPGGTESRAARTGYPRQRIYCRTHPHAPSQAYLSRNGDGVVRRTRDCDARTSVLRMLLRSARRQIATPVSRLSCADVPGSRCPSSGIPPCISRSVPARISSLYISEITHERPRGSANLGCCRDSLGCIGCIGNFQLV